MVVRTPRRGNSSDKTSFNRAGRAFYLRHVLEALEVRQLLSTAPTSWTPVGFGGGGTDENAYVNPLNTNEMYVESDMGQVWHTKDGGQTFTTIDQTQLWQNAYRGGVQFTSNTNIQYAVSSSNSPKITTDDGSNWATVAGWTAVGASGAQEIYADPNRSDRFVVMSGTETPSGGTTDKTHGNGAYYNWTLYFSGDTGNTLSVIGSYSGKDRDYKPRIVGTFFDPNGQNIYIGTNVGLFYSNNGGQTWGQSTMNLPTNADPNLTAVMSSFTGSNNGTTIRLWCVAWNQQEYLSSDGAIIGDGFATDYAGIYSIDLPSSSPSAANITWVSKDSAGPLNPDSSQGWGNLTPYELFPRSVQMAENDINDIWIGGGNDTNLSPYKGSASNRVWPIAYGSHDGGATWTRLLKTGEAMFPDNVHTEFPGELPNQNIQTEGFGTTGDFNWGYSGSCASFLVDRANPNIITWTSAGPLFRSNNAADFTNVMWRDIASPGPSNPMGLNSPDNNLYNSSTMNQTAVWNLTFPVPGPVFASVTDVTAQWSPDNGATWQESVTSAPSFANTYYQATYDWRTGMMYAVIADLHNLFTTKYDDASVEQLGSDHVVMSSDLGKTWTLMHSFVNPLKGTEAVAIPLTCLALDPARPNRLYIGMSNHNDIDPMNGKCGGGIWYTDDAQDGANSIWIRLGNGTGASATAIYSGGAITGFNGLVGGSGYDPATAKVAITGGGTGASGATATVTVGANGTITGINLTNGGTGYTAAPIVTIYSNKAGSQPSRDITNDGINNPTFSGMHPTQIMVIADPNWATDGNTDANHEMIITVMAPRALASGTMQPNSGIWVSLDGGNSWIDRSGPLPPPGTAYLPWTGTGSVYTNMSNNSVPGGTLDYTNNTLTYVTMGLTIDPNDSTGGTWFACTYDYTTASQGPIYKTTNFGQTWSIWATQTASGSDAGCKVWIQPGGRVMLLAGNRHGVMYCPDYTDPNPKFYDVATFPFANVNNITSNPFNPDEVWISTMGSGIWKGNIRQLAPVAQVTGVSAVTTGSGEVKLTWTVTTPTPDTYRIEESLTGFGGWTTAATVSNANDNAFLVTGLTGNTQYYFRIISVNAAGDSMPSATVSVRTDAATGLAANEGFTGTSGNLNGTGSGTGWNGNWTASTDGNTTLITGNLGGSNPPDQSGAGAAQVKSASSIDASRNLSTTIGTPGSVLWVSFEEYTAAGAGLVIGDTANGICIGTPQYANRIGIVTFTGGNSTIQNTNTTVTASTVHLLVARIEFRADGSAWVRVFVDPTPGDTYPDSEATWQTSSFSGIVSASMLGGGTAKLTLRKPNSGTAKYDELRLGGTYADVTPLSTATAPNATPINVTTSLQTYTDGTLVQDLDQTQVKLTWTDNSTNEEGFAVYTSTGTLLDRILTTNRAGTVTVYTYYVTNLSANTSNSFKVTAFNHVGETSQVASNATTTLKAALATTTTLSPVTVNNGFFTLNWSSVTNADGYYVQVTDNTRNNTNDGEVNWVTLNAGAALTGTTYTTTAGDNLQQNTLYYFRILPYRNIAQSGSAINVKDAISNLSTSSFFPAPASVSAAGASDTQIAVSWTDTSKGESGFTVQKSSDGGATWITASSTIASGATTYTVTGLSADTQYAFRVCANGAASDINPWSSTATGRTLNTNSGLLYYDGFNYTPDATQTQEIAGQNGGVGAGGPWSLTSGNADVLPSSLTPTNSTVATYLLTTGNSAESSNVGSLTRSFNASMGGTNGTVVWASVLVKTYDATPSGFIDLVDATGGGQNVRFGYAWGGNYSLGIAGTSNYVVNTGAAPAAGETHLLVVKVSYGATCTINLWVDCDPRTAEGSLPASLLTLNTTGALPQVNAVNMQSAASKTNDWDEFRAGTSYAAVTPQKNPTNPPTVGPTVYDGFAYLPDATQHQELGVGNGGVGWHYGWTAGSSGGANIIAGSLVSNDSTVAANLLTTGNAYNGNNTGAVTRNLNSAIGGTGVVWFSTLVTTYDTLPGAYVDLVDSTGAAKNVRIGFGWANNYSLGVTGSNNTNSGTRPAAGDTHLLVVRITYNTAPTKDVIDMWVDPNPTLGDPGTPFLSLTSNYDLTSFNALSYTSVANKNANWDETRIGTNYNAVVPVKVPAAPSSLAGTSGAGNIALTWNDNSTNESGFNVERSTDQVSWTHLGSTPTTGANAAGYTDSTVSGGTYYYRASATNASGDSVYSNVATVVYSALPNAPSGLAATPSGYSVGLTWTDNANNETGFHVWRSTDNVNFTSIQTLGANSTAWNDPTVNANTLYYYYVTSYNGAGDSGHSNTSSAMTIPAVPTSVSATASTSAVSVSLTWTETNGASSYAIQRSSNGGSSWSSVATSVSSTNYTDSTVVGDTNYIYQVNATNGTGTSSWSGSSNSVLTLPAVPTSVSATASTSAVSISLTWSESGAGAASYAIQRSSNGGSSWSNVATGVTGTSYTDSTGLSPNTTYIYEVDATDATGTTAWSGNSNSALTIPAAPTGLTAAPGTSTITLNWNSNTNEANYTVQRSADNGSTWTTLSTTVANTATSYVDTPPTAGQAYLYQIAATNTTGSSAYNGIPCNVATFTAYDGFAYAAGTGKTYINGQNGGAGWTSAWSSSGGTTNSYGVNSYSLAYSPDGGVHNLQTSGNSTWVLYAGSDSRTFNDSTYGQDGQVRWMSFLMQPNLSGGTVALGGYIGFNELKLGLPTQANYGGRTTLGGATYNFLSSVPSSQGTTVFVVAEVLFGSTDTVNIWVNPTSFASPGTASVTWNTPAGKTFTPATSVTVVMANNGQYSEPTFDEVRYGLSYAAVAPDPLGVAADASVTTPARSTPSLAIGNAWSIQALPASADVAISPFASLLTAPSVRSVAFDVHSGDPSGGYHTYAGQDSSSTMDLFTLDTPDTLLIQLPHH